MSVVEMMGLSVLIALISILVAGWVGKRHLLSYLLLLEMVVLLGLLILGECCSYSWQYISVVVLVMGVAEAGLGLSVAVKASRARSDDRIYLGSLVSP